MLSDDNNNSTLSPLEIKELIKSLIKNLLEVDKNHTTHTDNPNDAETLLAVPGPLYATIKKSLTALEPIDLDQMFDDLLRGAKTGLTLLETHTCYCKEGDYELDGKELEAIKHVLRNVIAGTLGQ